MCLQHFRHRKFPQLFKAGHFTFESQSGIVPTFVLTTKPAEL